VVEFGLEDLVSFNITPWITDLGGIVDRVDEVVDDAVVAVHGRQLAADEVPPVVRVPGRVDVTVVEERDDDDVGGKHEQRHDVVDHQGRQTARGEVLVQRQCHRRHRDQ